MRETRIMTHADSLWAKSLEAHNDSLQRSVDSLQARFDALQAKTDLLYNVVEISNDGVNNQLSAANHLLTLVAVIVTIAAIWLGIVIEKKWRKMESMAATVDDKKKNIEDLAKSTEDLNEVIHNDIKGLYYSLRKEETKTFFERLVKEPQDIDNLEKLLLAREVDSENFQLLKEAYLHLPKDIDEEDEDDSVIVLKADFKESYMLQFFQHFFYESIIDDDIRPDFIESFKNIFGKAFESDIIRATEGMCRALTESKDSFDKVDVLTLFLKAINGCKYKDFALLRKIIEEKLTSVNLLKSAIEHCEADNVNLQLFRV